MLEMITEILKLVAMYGLPLVLAVWFVFRIDVTLTKLVTLMEAFIKWQNEKEVTRVANEKDVHDTLEELKDQGKEIAKQIEILGVRLEK